MWHIRPPASVYCRTAWGILPPTSLSCTSCIKHECHYIQCQIEINIGSLSIMNYMGYGIAQLVQSLCLRVWGFIHSRDKRLSLLQTFNTSLGAHPASYSVSTKGVTLTTRPKVKNEWSCGCGCSPSICLCDVDRDKFIITFVCTPCITHWSQFCCKCNLLKSEVLPCND